MKVPIVTIVGKPNVGKSMFFNRMAGSRVAIISEEAGTTRDRIFRKIEHPEMDFFLVDTGGLEFESTADIDIEENMQKQTRIAIEESDLVIFMISGNSDLTANDFKAAELLRKASNKKSILLAVNKCDHPMSEADLAYVFELGLGNPISISALHNVGIDKLTDEIIETLKGRHFLTKNSEQYKELIKSEENILSVALVGKTNVGKSSLINALLNQEKLVVSATPHTTRDSTDSIVRHGGKDYNFIDTAGMRSRGKIGKGIEHFSVLRTISSIERCDVAILVIDTSEIISHQDQQIAKAILDANKGLIILANKWDIPQGGTKPQEQSQDLPQKINIFPQGSTKAQGQSQDELQETNKETKKESDESEQKRKSAYINRLQRKFPFLSWAPLIFTSAVTKQNLTKIFDQIELIYKERQSRIPTAKLNHFVEKIVEQHKPSGSRRISPKLFYVTQVDVNPPHFVFFVNKKKYFHFSYLRYLENKMREQFGFIGTPIVLGFKEKEARYKGKE